MANLKVAPKKPVKKAVAAVEETPKAKKGFGAKKVGGKDAAPKKKKAAKILFKAPADFKPAFFEVDFSTMKDGLLNGASVVINRVKGKWDNPDAKRFNLAEYDIATQNGIVSRLGAIYAPNVLKRLPGGAKFSLILRVNKKAEGNVLGANVKAAKQLVESKKQAGKMKWAWFEDKKDITYRKLRKINRILAGAFVDVQLPPSGRKSKKATDEE